MPRIFSELSSPCNVPHGVWQEELGSTFNNILSSQLLLTRPQFQTGGRIISRIDDRGPGDLAHGPRGCLVIA